MRKLALKILLNGISFYLVSMFFLSIKLADPITALIAGTVLALLNSLIRPILMVIALPLNLITMGLFILLIDTGMVMLTDKVVPGLHITGFWLALATALVATVINSLFRKIYRES